MEKEREDSKQSPRETEGPSVPAPRKSWEEPKLAFVEPKLTKHGDLEKVTGKGDTPFFGEFSP